MREVYIITKEGEHIFYRIPQIPQDASKEEQNDLKYAHETYFRKYIIENNLNIDHTGKTSYALAEELMKVGLSPIIVENKEMFIFIPKQITKEQYLWYKKMYHALVRYNVHYACFEGEEIINNDPDFEEPNKVTMKRFYKNIEKNLKSQKEVENDEYRPNI